MGKVVNKAELEALLGVSHTTLTEWQEQGLPIEKRGERGQENKYDVPAVIRWMIDREVKKASRETQRDRLTRLQADRIEREELVAQGELVPAGEIEPTWKHRVLSAAAFLAGQHSRLAGILEATPGVEAKRKVLRTEFSQFLTRLGVDGERMQDEVEALLGRVAENEAAAFMKRIAGVDAPGATKAPAGAARSSAGDAAGVDAVARETRTADDPTPDTAQPGEPGVGDVRPAGEGPALGMG